MFFLLSLCFFFHSLFLSLSVSVSLGLYSWFNYCIILLTAGPEQGTGAATGGTGSADEGDEP